MTLEIKFFKNTSFTFRHKFYTRYKFSHLSISITTFYERNINKRRNINQRLTPPPMYNKPHFNQTSEMNKKSY